ncbi:MAG: ribose-5-phosphate isomerase A [Rhodobacterales bacterium]|nr:ribose-5-phosphate isomerase A [Rhodobacterales bacterium]
MESGYEDPRAVFRSLEGERGITDEGNFILDLHLNSISDEDNLSTDLNLIPGVVENGLFVNICKCAVLADENEQVTIELKDSYG